MKVTAITYKDANITLSIDDLVIFHNCLKEVRFALENRGFETRLNISPRQAYGFLEDISREIRESGKHEEDIKFSWFEILFFKNIFSEVCNGVAIPSFEEKIGVSKDEIEKKLSLILKLRGEMDYLKKVRRASYQPSSKNSQDKDEEI